MQDTWSSWQQQPAGDPWAEAARTVARGHYGSGGDGRPLAQRPLTTHERATIECSFDRKLALIALLMHGAMQAISLLSWSALPPHERMQRLLSILHAFAIWVLPMAAPVLYLRWRKEMLVAYRVAFFAFPLLRKARGIQRVLDAEPQPGPRGALKDLFRVFWGSRLVAVVASSLLTPLPLLPLLPHLLIQAYTVAMARANDTLCATPLLSHPLTVRRIHNVHNAMHLLVLVLPGGLGQLGASLPAAANATVSSSELRERECESFLTFMFLTVGLALPIVLLLVTEPLSSLQQWEARWYGRGGGGAGGGGGSTSGVVRRCGSGWLQPATVTLEAIIRQLCGASWMLPPRRLAAGLEHEEGEDGEGEDVSGGDRPAGLGREATPRRWPSLLGWQRAVAWWLLLSLLWVLAVASAV